MTVENRKGDPVKRGSEFAAALRKRGRKDEKRLLDAKMSEIGRARARAKIGASTAFAARLTHVPALGHKIRDLVIRRSDNEAGLIVGLRPLRDKPGTFVEGFVARRVTRIALTHPHAKRPWRFVGRQTFVESDGQVVTMTDWREVSLYDVVEFARQP